MFISRNEHLNTHAGSELRDIRVNSALPESVSEPDRNAALLDQIALRVVPDSLRSLRDVGAGSPVIPGFPS